MDGMNGDFVTRYQKPISPAERKFSFLLRLAEDVIKVPVFGCMHCGECILSSTGFTCCQRCPKRLRNGPCGGTGEKGACEVYPDRKCVWYLIYKRSKRLKRLSMIYPVRKIHNWQLEGSSAWLNVFLKRIDPPAFFPPRKKASGADDV